MTTRLRKLRTKRSLTLVQAAGLLDTDPSNLARIERGEQTPSLALARRIADFYRIGLNAVFNDVSPRETS